MTATLQIAAVALWLVLAVRHHLDVRQGKDSFGDSRKMARLYAFVLAALMLL